MLYLLGENKFYSNTMFYLFGVRADQFGVLHEFISLQANAVLSFI